MRTANCIIALTLLVAVAGCANQPKQAQVKGTVTLDGKPLTSGTATFEVKNGRAATAKIVNGEFVDVTTYTPGDGVAVGQHRVVVSANEDPPDNTKPGDTKAPKGDYMSGKPVIPPAYGDPNTSGLTAEIKPGENTIVLNLLSTGPAK